MVTKLRNLGIIGTLGLASLIHYNSFADEQNAEKPKESVKIEQNVTNAIPQQRITPINSTYTQSNTVNLSADNNPLTTMQIIVNQFGKGFDEYKTKNDDKERNHHYTIEDFPTRIEKQLTNKTYFEADAENLYIGGKYTTDKGTDIRVGAQLGNGDDLRAIIGFSFGQGRNKSTRQEKDKQRDKKH